MKSAGADSIAGGLFVEEGRGRAQNLHWGIRDWVFNYIMTYMLHDVLLIYEEQRVAAFTALFLLI